jgi:GH18 family chitinase
MSACVLGVTGPATVTAKTEFAAELGLAGVFFWEGGQDALDASVSLMAAARVAAEAAAEASKPEL